MYKIYKIKENDTLESIAAAVNTTVENLLEINGINRDYRLIPNAFLIVPAVQEQLFDNYVVKKGDTMYEIAQNYKTSVNSLLSLNGLLPYDYIYPGQTILVPKDGVSFHVTEEGDTLESAAKKLGTNSGILILQNENIYLLPGQLLTYNKNN